MVRTSFLKCRFSSPLDRTRGFVFETPPEHPEHVELAMAETGRHPEFPALSDRNDEAVGSVQAGLGKLDKVDGKVPDQATKERVDALWFAQQTECPKGIPLRVNPEAIIFTLKGEGKTMVASMDNIVRTVGDKRVAADGTVFIHVQVDNSSLNGYIAVGNVSLDTTASSKQQKGFDTFSSIVGVYKEAKAIGMQPGQKFSIKYAARVNFPHGESFVRSAENLMDGTQDQIGLYVGGKKVANLRGGEKVVTTGELRYGKNGGVFVGVRKGSQKGWVQAGWLE